jgi:thiamine-monophosphate kinase
VTETEVIVGAHVAMGQGHEFDAIRAMLARWGTLAEGIGDDAAVLTPPTDAPLVVSTDASVEGVHFRTGWLTPEEIGARAAAAALSDVAAMGGEVRWMLVALEVPPSWQESLPAIADGIGRLVADADARIIGGNITRGERLALTLTVIGSATRPVLRSGARVGDALWVTGALGGARRALRALEAGTVPSDTERGRFAHPVPRLREGAWLAAIGARAMLDISDGLAADAGHLAAASGVRCELWADAIPRFGDASVEDALASGEEYELLVATDADLDADGFARRFGVSLTCVGRIVLAAPNEPLVVVRASRAGDAGPGPVAGDTVAGDTVAGDTVAGVRVALPPGHDHFSR